MRTGNGRHGNYGSNAMNSRSTLLAELIDELHDVNQLLVGSARPLHQRSDLEPDERQEIADHLRVGLARWDDITRKINEALKRPDGRH